MDLSPLLRELQGGHSPAVRTGLRSLLIGAIATAAVMVLLSPSMDGLIGLPGHELEPREAPVQVAPPRPPAQPQMTKAQRAKARRAAVLVAAREIGVREDKGENRGVRITTYRRAVTGPGEQPGKPEPWCADFVSWVWKRSGAPLGFGGRGSDYVPELVAWARLTRRWHWARDGYRPRPGDLVVFRVNGVMRGHVGLVAAVRNGRIHTIEGNYSDSVKRRTIKPWAPEVTGFIAPV